MFCHLYFSVEARADNFRVKEKKQLNLQWSQSICSVPRRVYCVLKRGLQYMYTELSKYRARMFKLLRNPEIDSKESIPPAYVAWRAGTTTPIPTRFPAHIDCCKIPVHDRCSVPFKVPVFSPDNGV